MFHAGAWGTVCKSMFGEKEAMVACRSLGLPGGQSVGNNVEDGSGRIWMDQVACGGSEQNISECTFKGWNKHDCSHMDDVGVRCGMPTAESVTKAVPGVRLVKHGVVIYEKKAC